MRRVELRLAPTYPTPPHLKRVKLSVERDDFVVVLGWLGPGWELERTSPARAPPNYSPHPHSTPTLLPPPKPNSHGRRRAGGWAGGWVVGGWWVGGGWVVVVVVCGGLKVVRAGLWLVFLCWATSGPPFFRGPRRSRIRAASIRPWIQGLHCHRGRLQPESQIVREIKGTPCVFRKRMFDLISGSVDGQFVWGSPISTYSHVAVRRDGENLGSNTPQAFQGSSPGFGFR